MFWLASQLPVLPYAEAIKLTPEMAPSVTLGPSCLAAVIWP